MLTHTFAHYDCVYTIKLDTSEEQLTLQMHAKHNDKPYEWFGAFNRLEFQSEDKKINVPIDMIKVYEIFGRWVRSMNRDTITIRNGYSKSLPIIITIRMEIPIICSTLTGTLELQPAFDLLMDRNTD